MGPLKSNTGWSGGSVVKEHVSLAQDVSRVGAQQPRQVPK